MCQYILVFLMSFHCNFLGFFCPMENFSLIWRRSQSLVKGCKFWHAAMQHFNMAMHWAVKVHQLWHGTSVHMVIFEDLALTLTTVAEFVWRCLVLRNPVSIHDIYTCKNKLHEQDWTAGKMPIIVLSWSRNITTCTKD